MNSGSNSIKKYILEKIRINAWFKFIKNTISDISNKLNRNLKYENLYQGILRYYTYVIGVTNLTSYVFFPKTKSLINNKEILVIELTFYEKMSKSELKDILKIIIHNNTKYKKIIKSEFEKAFIPDIIDIKTTKINDKITLSIDSDKYDIYGAHYERLKRIFIGPQLHVDLWICILLLRYRFYGKDKESICLCVDLIYNFLRDNKMYDLALETFAGSLNSNLKNYCSLFYDVEKRFGSKGSFFTMDLTGCEYNVYAVNPPYVATVIERSFGRVYDVLEKCPNINILITVPDWRSKSELENDTNVQVTLGEKHTKRFEEPYPGYNLIRNSKYFRKVYFVGNFSYYNFFADTKRDINVPTLIITLSNDKNNNLINRFDAYVINKVAQ